MPFSWDFLLNVLENDDSNSQTQFGVLITSNNQIFKSRDYTNPPDLTTLKAYPTPEKVVGSFFITKIREKDELKGMCSNFTPWLSFFDHRVENCLGVGELGLSFDCSHLQNKMLIIYKMDK